MAAGDFSVGVEEELFVVDRATAALRPAADQVLAAARANLGEQVEAELNRAQIETGTAVCGTLDEVRAELRRLRRGVIGAAAEAGCGLLSAGTHPSASWQGSGVNQSKGRYRRLEEEFQVVARQQLVSGCHVHVGIADRELAVDVLDRCRLWLGPVVALAANSPFWAGADTGYSSYRTEVWTRWPLTGMPEPLGSRAGYDDLVAALVATGAMPDATFLYWDVRPSARYETLEFRAADACTSIDDTVMVAALWRALARSCAADARRGKPAPRPRRELVQAASWRAARYGLDGTLVDLVGLRTAPARQVVEDLLAYVRPALADHGEWQEVSALVQRVLVDGNGAARQRAAFARRGEIGDVVELLVTATAP